MNAHTSLLAAATATLALLAGCSAAARRAAAPPAGSADLEAPRSPEEALPGVSLEGLTAVQRSVTAAYAQEEFCHCGCPHTISRCLREHQGCKHAQRTARLAAKLAAGGAGKADIQSILLEYYASFDRRAKLETKGFGPPLGEPSAPVTVIEYSDFTCPYCQLFRPVLERFVDEHRGRVKLVYKPFPIQGHLHSMEAAQAAEWAREKGLFWKMHDALFARPHALSPEDLVAYARELGGDGDDLRAALEQERYRARVEGSMAESRATGLKGTPTLFFDGRRYTLPDLTPELLEHTLEDEEEWLKHRGWERD